MAFGLRQKILDQLEKEQEKENMSTKGDALRRLANFVDDNEELFEDIELSTQQIHLGRWNHSDPKAALVELAKAAANDRFIEVKKDYRSSYFSLYLDFHGIKLEAWTSRETVCEKRVVGTETVIKQVPVKFEDQAVEQEIVEWDCHPHLKS